MELLLRICCAGQTKSIKESGPFVPLADNGLSSSACSSRLARPPKQRNHLGKETTKDNRRPLASDSASQETSKETQSCSRLHQLCSTPSSVAAETCHKARKRRKSHEKNFLSRIPQARMFVLVCPPANRRFVALQSVQWLCGAHAERIRSPSSQTSSSPSRLAF